MRTPLGLIPEKDDVFRVYYTCQQKEKRSKEGGDFFPVGMARVKLVD
jgi:hypothetical protein